jgi:hypothetical protein
VRILHNEILIRSDICTDRTTGYGRSSGLSTSETAAIVLLTRAHFWKVSNSTHIINAGPFFIIPPLPLLLQCPWHPRRPAVSGFGGLMPSSSSASMLPLAWACIGIRSTRPSELLWFWHWFAGKSHALGTSPSLMGKTSD